MPALACAAMIMFAGAAVAQPVRIVPPLSAADLEKERRQFDAL